MPTYKITAPDGKTYKVTGEGSAEDALRHIQATVGRAAPAPAAPKALTPDDPMHPAYGMNPLEKLAVGAGAAVTRAGRGLGKLVGMDTSAADEDAKLYEKMHPGGWGTAGEVVGDIAMTALPSGAILKATSALPRAAAIATNIAGQGAMNAAITPENRGVAALLGAGGQAVGDAAGAGFRGLRRAMQNAKSVNRAGNVLARELGDDAASTAAKLRAGPVRDATTRDIPLNTAQTIRQIEGDTPEAASIALAKMQLGAARSAPDDFAEFLRKQNEALYDAATTKAGADASQLDALTTVRENATGSMRKNALKSADDFATAARQQAADARSLAMGTPVRESELGDLVQGQVSALRSESVPGSPQRGLADLVSRTLSENPNARQLYELRKMLAAKLNGPMMPGDEIAAITKGAQRETMRLIGAIDDRLQQASGMQGPGAWEPYLREYKNQSLPVSSARAQGQITEALTPEGGAVIGETPIVTRHKLAQALKKHGTSKTFGSDRLTPAARQRYDDLTKFAQRNEEAMGTVKLAGTGGGGSQTALQDGLSGDLTRAGLATAAASAMPHAGLVYSVSRSVDKALNESMRKEVARMMLDPQRAAAGIEAALKRNMPLTQAQQVFRQQMTNAGTQVLQQGVRE